MNENARPLEFENRQAWRSWLTEHHATESEAWLVIRKKRSDLPRLFLEEAVEEALCYGWIDGRLNTRDAESFLLRFSPRKPNSIWSMSNIRRIEKLQQSGAMTEAGLASVREAKESGQWQAAIAREHPEVIPAALEAKLRRKKGALSAYRNLPAWRKKQYMHWLQSAGRDKTRRKRMEAIVERLGRSTPR